MYGMILWYPSNKRQPVHQTEPWPEPVSMHHQSYPVAKINIVTKIKLTSNKKKHFKEMNSDVGMTMVERRQKHY